MVLGDTVAVEEEAFLVQLGRELLTVLREMYDDAGHAAYIAFDPWVDAAPMPDNARRAIALVRRASGDQAQQQQQAPRSRRFVSVEEAPAVIRHHEEVGTCPNCSTAVETFVSLYVPHEEGVGFACPCCSEQAKLAILGAKLIREAKEL